MKPLNDDLSRILDTMTEGLGIPGEDGATRRIYDNAPGVFMPAVVDRVGLNRYTIGHYYEQEGELVPDPALEFIRWDGAWYPIACSLPMGQRNVAVVCDAADGPVDCDAQAYAELRCFVGAWLRNIQRQQRIRSGASSRS